jgi:signal transduction histidine kinase/CheY-like chemotaxis protein
MRDSLLPESGIPYMVLDGKGRSLGWNDEAFEAFGDCAQGDIRAIVQPNVTSEEVSRFEYLLEDAIPHFTFEFSFPSNNGEVRWFRLIMSRLEKGGYLALFDDIESFKLRERSLVAARETAEKASMSRSQFLANISHEIRTPIQTIIGMMELLDETKLDEEQTEYVRQVKFSADVMLTLINDVLDFSKVEAGQLKIEHIEYDLSNVIERTVDLVSMEAHRKELEICIEIADDLPAMVIGDPSRLQQIILNLVKNAVKFTAKGYILVSAKSLGDKAHFEVTDTGIGIKSDVQDRLFTQFFQADASTTRKYGGTGLGLAISRNIVELMSGQIGVMNNPSGGSCFWFNIPLVAAEKQPPKETLPLRPDTKFLIVDDNELTLSILTSMLRSMGYSDITSSMSGEQALNALHGARTIAKPFDIVLIDMVMPEMDGWRLAAEINKNREINQAQLYLMVPEGSFRGRREDETPRMVQRISVQTDQAPEIGRTAQGTLGILDRPRNRRRAGVARERNRFRLRRAARKRRSDPVRPRFGRGRFRRGVARRGSDGADCRRPSGKPQAHQDIPRKGGSQRRLGGGRPGSDRAYGKEQG